MFLDNQWVKEEIKGRIKEKPWDKWKWNYNIPESIGCSKSSSKREVLSDRILPQETGKISNKWSNFTPKGTRTKPKGRRKELIKVREEINERVKTQQKTSMKLRADSLKR